MIVSSRSKAALTAALLAVTSSIPTLAQDTLRVEGLDAPVEILHDRWGMAHIYATTESDLFFAQGWNAARDRLFQLELWRRQATGTLAEILGPRELERDIGARLLRFRGDLARELRHYHPNGVEIVESFVRGINAYIEQTARDPSLLAPEFTLLGIRPQPWTPEIVISRHQGLVGNVRQELAIGRAIAALGPDLVRRLYWFHPGEPDLSLDPSVGRTGLPDEVLDLYTAYKSGVRFREEDLVAGHGDGDAYRRLAAMGAWASGLDDVRAEPHSSDRDFAPDSKRRRPLPGTIRDAGRPGPDRGQGVALGALPSESDLIARGEAIGSNNWVVSGSRTSTGMPFMANDPHRAQQAPSLRYWAHLVGPGWNVIGGGEPALPGISIGHNEHGAWGLTVFGVDSEDLYVYETNPSNPRQYRYAGGWVDMRVERDTIVVEGQAPVEIELRFTRHGPVLYQDSASDVAYALRAAWLDYGAAPYLASLRMDQAKTWEEFREACSYSHIPGENMVWADRAGNIGYQAVGVAPLRPNWSGLVPVPGDGRFEWEGYLPIRDLPHIENPEQGFWATANESQVDATYPFRRAIAWTWADPFRADRVDEVLGSGRRLSLADMMQLQHDELSIPARTLVPLLEPLEPDDSFSRTARALLLEWDHVLDRASVAAGIYVAWERRLAANVRDAVVPASAREYVGNVPLTRTVQWLLVPDGRFGEDPLAARDSILLLSLDQAVELLAERLGNDLKGWQYGQDDYKHALIRHPMSAALPDSLRARYDVGPHPRGGYGNTVNATGGGDNQTSGASFRIIADLSDWDRTVGTNTPGQSGDPSSPHYRDLFPIWAQGRYFPVLFSREKVEGVAEARTVLLGR